MERPIKENYLIYDEFTNYPTRFAINEYLEALEEYCDVLERFNRKLNDKLYMINGEHIINPCEGCRDYCYRTDECKSNGACANTKLEELTDVKN